MLFRRKKESNLDLPLSIKDNLTSDLKETVSNCTVSIDTDCSK